MNKLFDVAAGSVTGKDHVLAGRNNQDAFYWSSDELITIAIVCDGCGEFPHSEVGAKIGARLIGEKMRSTAEHFSRTNWATQNYKPFPFWERVRISTLAQLQNLISAMNGDFREILNNYFLFTAVGALITPWGTSVFSIGDGIIILNKEIIRIGPFPDNAPPYLGYGVSEKETIHCGLAGPKFQIHRVLSSDGVRSILIGTDGITDLMSVADTKMPGRAEKVGSIEQFWTEDRYFKNPDMIRRKLALINKTSIKPDWENRRMIKEHGLLPDDTTLVVMRRRPE